MGKKIICSQINGILKISDNGNNLFIIVIRNYVMLINPFSLYLYLQINRRIGFILVILILSGLLSSCSNNPQLKSKPATAEKSGVALVYGTPPQAKPLPEYHVYANPYLLNGRNGIHYDTHNSDVTNDPGPMGISPSVVTRKLNSLGKSIPSMLFDSKGRIITVMISFTSTWLYLMDPDSLFILAEEELPRKSNIHIFNHEENDASGGGYLHLTPTGEVIIPKMDKKIAFYKVIEEGEKPHWYLVKEIDLNDDLPENAYINDAVLDFDGQLWFTTSMGMVGYVDKVDQKVETYTFPEGLQNQLAIDSKGVYVLTHEYLNKLSIQEDGEIKLLWRSPYDHSAGLNGLVASGSGTSPTLLGNNDDLIAIADNGTPNMHMNVYHRSDGRLICSVPVFSTNNTGCENSLIGYGNDVVIEDNGGFELFFGDAQNTNKGLIKIHVRDDLSGADIVWENYDLKASTTPTLSTANGLIYSYCVKEGQGGSDAWFLSMVDWETGETVYEYWVGSGKNFADMLQPVVINSGAFYIGTNTGLLVIRDNL